MLKIRTGGATAVVLAAVSCAHAQDAVQWRAEDGGNGHWYAVHTDPGTGSGGVCWADALSRARSAGGDLISLASPEENQFVLATLATFEDCGCYSFLGWIGLVGDGTWSDGEIVEWTNWEGGVPSGDGPHATMAFPELNGMWNDIGGPDGCHPGGCCPLNRWVVEWSADCNGDGIVDYGQILDGTYADEDGNGVPDCCDAGVPCDPSPGDAVQWRVEDGGNGHWYQFDSSPQYWNTAAERAQSQGGHLATSNESFENDFLWQIYENRPNPCASFWLGGQLVGGSWAWVTGEEFSFADWHPGEPNGAQFGETVIEFGYPACNPNWNDTVPDADKIGRPFIIEWSADCNEDGIVDYGQILDGTYADENGNGVPDCCDAGVPCDCPADITGDGRVDAADLGVLLAVWNTDGGTIPEADINRDGTVNASDLGLLLGSWGLCS